MNSSQPKSGRIVGSLVISTCLVLGVVWLTGHLLIAKYPMQTTDVASTFATTAYSIEDEKVGIQANSSFDAEADDDNAEIDDAKAEMRNNQSIRIHYLRQPIRQKRPTTRSIEIDSKNR